MEIKDYHMDRDPTGAIGIAMADAICTRRKKELIDILSKEEDVRTHCQEFLDEAERLAHRDSVQSRGARINTILRYFPERFSKLQGKRDIRNYDSNKTYGLLMDLIEDSRKIVKRQIDHYHYILTGEILYQ